MKTLVLAACLPLLATVAMAEEQTEGRHLAELSFASIDDTGRGYVDMGQMEQTRQDIFVSMDADDSGKLTEDEMLAWGYGFQTVAEDENKQRAYETAMKIVFAFWDRDGNGEITEGEHRRAIIADIQRADLNGDAVLDKSEFFNGFSVMVATRIALKD